MINYPLSQLFHLFTSITQADYCVQNDISAQQHEIIIPLHNFNSSLCGNLNQDKSVQYQINDFHLQLFYRRVLSHNWSEAFKNHHFPNLSQIPKLGRK